MLVSEIIARICRDLGIHPDWSRWHDEASSAGEAGVEPPGVESFRVVFADPPAEAEPHPPPVAGPDTG